MDKKTEEGLLAGNSLDELFRMYLGKKEVKPGDEVKLADVWPVVDDE